MAKSEWGAVSLQTERDKDALRSWFNGMVDDLGEPIRAAILTRLADDTTLKLRALFRQPDGTMREAVRTTGHRFSITITEPTQQRWA